ncbi:hypothetical protein AA313_de0206322 [Arthrobotrys entomopaga]|nr:hypothetical protein AA313_de0206322 [Arthrobotrys entomopaga]
MPAGGKSFTNHPGIIDFQGNSYFFYHNGALPGGSGYTRSICIEKFSYNSDGTIPSIAQTSSGAPQLGTLNPYVRQEAETIAFSSGLKTEVCSEGGIDVCFIDNGDYIKVKGVAFGTGAKSLSVRVASATSGGQIEVRLGSTSGTLVGTCSVPGTGGWQTWTTVTCAISGATGTQDLYFRFTGSSGTSLFNFNWWQFTSSSGTSPTSSTTSTTTKAITSTSSTTSARTTTSSSGGTNCGSLYGQCGGIGWTGGTCCSQGTCTYSNPYYSQCL